MVNGKKKWKKKKKKRKKKNGLSTTIEEISIIEDHPDYAVLKVDKEIDKNAIPEANEEDEEPAKIMVWTTPMIP